MYRNVRAGYHSTQSLTKKPGIAGKVRAPLSISCTKVLFMNPKQKNAFAGSLKFIEKQRIYCT